jgi:hypothetical protein
VNCEFLRIRSVLPILLWPEASSLASSGFGQARAVEGPGGRGGTKDDRKMILLGTFHAPNYGPSFLSSASLATFRSDIEWIMRLSG